MRLTIIAPLALLALTLTLAAAEGPSRAQLGEKIPDITLRDAAGKLHRLHNLKDQKAIVLVFLSFECPVSNSYCEPLAEMVKEYGKYGVTFWGLTTNEDDTQAHVEKAARDFNLNFPVFKDDKLRSADAVQAQCTPEVFVLDGDFTLRYRGRIDDGWSARLKKHKQVSRHDLRQVLGEMLSGRPVAVSATQAIGCPIVRATSAVTRAGKVTYHRDVEPILQKHCQSCHRPGEVGPFALMTYKQAVNWGDDIKGYTQQRLMPPWKPAAGVPFHNERRLSDAELATLAAWVDGGMPQGDVSQAPAPRTFPQGWQLGTPDLILSAEEDFTLAPTGKDLFRCFVLPTNLPEDVHISAVELRPSNPRVVHHVLLFVDTQGQGRKLAKAAQEKESQPAPASNEHGGKTGSSDRGPGYTVSMGVGFTPQGGLSGWAPGQMPRYLPEGVAYALPKGADVIMQVHFHRNGRLERDRTQIGLYFSKTKAEKPYRGGVIAGGGIGPLRVFFSIPAGVDNHRLTGDTWATGDFTLFSVMPHMHDDAARRGRADARVDPRLGLQLAGDVPAQGADPGEGGDALPRRGGLR
jgi:peroxiredoxin/mono/diheme cytochrome c family protein